MNRPYIMIVSPHHADSYEMYLGKTNLEVKKADNAHDAIFQIMKSRGYCELCVTDYFYMQAIDLAPLIMRDMKMLEIINDPGFMNAKMLLDFNWIKFPVVIRHFLVISPLSISETIFQGHDYPNLDFLTVPFSTEQFEQLKTKYQLIYNEN